jgi:hypothetical protein
MEPSCAIAFVRTPGFYAMVTVNNEQFILVVEYGRQNFVEKAFPAFPHVENM